MPQFTFATKNKKDEGETEPTEKKVRKQKTPAADKDATKASGSKEVAGTEKATKKVKADTTEKKVSAAKKRGSATANKDTEPEIVKKPEQKLYTLKFNSPILPFAKFPLTQNKYIQDFLRKYEEDKDNITRVIGVHF